MHQYEFTSGPHGTVTASWDVLTKADLLLNAAPHARTDEGTYRPFDGVLLQRDGHVELTIFEADDPQYLGGRTDPLTADERRIVQAALDDPSATTWIWRGANLGLNIAAQRFCDGVGKVEVITRHDDRERWASCFLCWRRDLAVTAFHVVDPRKVHLRAIRFGGTEVTAEVVGQDENRDIAILQLDSAVDAHPLAVARPAADLHLGAPVLVMGHPDMPGLDASVSIYDLNVASIKESYLTKSTMIELSTHLGSGFSGSAVVDARQLLVGVIVGYPDATSGSTDENHEPWPRWTPLAVAADHVGELLAQVTGSDKVTHLSDV